MGHQDEKRDWARLCGKKALTRLIFSFKFSKTKGNMATALSKYIASIDREELTREEEAKFVRIYRNKEEGWKEAQEKIIRNNLLYVVKLARNFSNDETVIFELISEGNLALLQSLNNFDPNKEAKFSTFATFRIRGAFYAFFRSHSRYRHFKISDNNVNLAKKARDFTEDFELNKSRKPTVDEIAKHCEIDRSKALLIAELAEVSTVPIQAEISYNDDSKQVEIADPTIKTPFTETKDKENSILIEKIIASLPLNHQIIVNKRFGLKGEDRTDLASIGKELNLTKERVRQIEKKSLQLIHDKLNKIE